jgi:hypothetical protein
MMDTDPKKLVGPTVVLERSESVYVPGGSQNGSVVTMYELDPVKSPSSTRPSSKTWPDAEMLLLEFNTHEFAVSIFHTLPAGTVMDWVASPQEEAFGCE